MCVRCCVLDCVYVCKHVFVYYMCVCIYLGFWIWKRYIDDAGGCVVVLPALEDGNDLFGGEALHLLALAPLNQALMYNSGLMCWFLDVEEVYF